MLKVIVIGCPGAGKSTFARRLRNATGLPLYYLDMIWHRTKQIHVAQEEFDLRLQEIVGTKRWIIDGNYLRTLDFRLQACDTVFFLDYPLDVCLSGAMTRIGKPRQDLPWLETELDAEFKQWIIDFPTVQLPQIRLLLKKYRQDKNIVVFESRTMADEYLQAAFEGKIR